MSFVSKIVSKNEALRLAQICINGSILVEVMPFPDDEYQVTVRKDQERVLFDKFLVIRQGSETRIEGGIAHTVTLAEAVNGVRPCIGRGCYVGSHDICRILKPDQVELIDYLGEEDAGGKSGFIIRPHVVDGEITRYLVEEWVHGDIVKTLTGAYPAVRRWISDQHADHWKRRYTLESLIDIWNEVLEIPLVGEKLAESFMFFPHGACLQDVLMLIREANPLFKQVTGVVDGKHYLRKQVCADGNVSAGSELCSECSAEVTEVVGCPGGEEVCNDCFDAARL